MLAIDRWDVITWEEVHCHKCKAGIKRDLQDLRDAFRENLDPEDDRFYFHVTFDDRSSGKPHEGMVPDDGYFVFVTVRNNYTSEWQIEWLHNCGAPQEPKFSAKSLYFKNEE